jgi:thiol:disulfide interchange protein DsbD
MKFITPLLVLLMFIGSLNSVSHAGSFLDNPATSLEQMVSDEEPEFLPVNQAFEFNFEQKGDNLILHWTIAPEYYLYRDKIKFAVTDATLGEVTYPFSTTIEDEYFGTSHIYREELTLTVPLSKIGNAGVMKVKYQGCADAGLCYPPVKQVMPLIKSKTADTAMMASNSVDPDIDDTIVVSQQNDLASKLASGGLLLTLLAFFGLGVGLAFTPCVFPMYPILTGIIAGQCDKMTTKHGFLLSMSYVQGMAVTYAGLGLVVASAGVKFQAYFQHPYVLISLSLLFVLLSLSMFGWFEIALPAKWQERLTAVSNKQKGGSFTGVFFMGALSGLIASPCTTAPLSGALLYVAQSGDLFLGGLTLYILSLGMGLPLLILGASGGKLLPKAGAWMDAVKTVFGFMLLAVPLILLDRIIDFDYTLTAGAVLTIALCAYLYTIQQGFQSAKVKTAVTFVSLGLFIVAILALKQVWFPQNQPIIQAQTQQHDTDEHGFVNVTSLAELEQQLVIAKAAGKPLMIDLFAEWCVACKEFEKYTFADPTVKQQMNKFLLVRADVTENNETDLALLENFDVLGLPTLLFFNPQSKELDQQRITGFMDADKFNQHLLRVLKQ